LWFKQLKLEWISHASEMSLLVASISSRSENCSILRKWKTIFCKMNFNDINCHEYSYTFDSSEIEINYR
jgi:hypothetical protein